MNSTNPKHLRLIAYDIVSDRQRTRMAKLAVSIADRIQDSVYEGPLTDKQVAAFLRRAEPLLDTKTDSLRLYTLCQRCRTKVICIERPGRTDLFSEADRVV